MRNILFTLLFSFVGLTAFAQIPINTPFQVSTPNPIDNRLTIATLGDTSTISDLYDGLQTWVKDVDQLWVYDGGKWLEFKTDRTGKNVSATYCYQTLFDKIQKTDSIIDIIMIGDSRVERGQTPDVLQRKWQDFYGSAGYGAASPNINSGLWNRFYNDVTVLDLSGEALNSISGQALKIAPGGILLMVPVDEFATYNKFTSVDIYYEGESGNTTFDISIDNSIIASESNIGTGVQKKTVSGLSDLEHRFQIDNTGADTLVIYEINFKRLNVSGVRFHRIGNAGITTAQQKSLMGNTYLFEDIQPDLVYVRLGVNGGAGSVDAQKANVDTIINSIKNVLGLDSLCRYVIVGETDNTEAASLRDNMPPLNEAYKELAVEKNYGYIDLFSSVPSWEDFQKIGYSDDTVHENEDGAKYIGDRIFLHAFEPYYIDVDINSTSNNIIGTTNELAYFSSSDTIRSISQWVTDGQIVATPAQRNDTWLQINRPNGTMLGLGGFSGGQQKNWFNVTDLGGIVGLNWFAYLDGSDYRQTGGGVAPALIRGGGSNAFRFSTSPIADTDSVITWTDVFTIQNDGDIVVTGDVLGITNPTGGANTLQASLNDLVNTGTANRLSYFNTTSTQSSLANWRTTGDKIGYNSVANTALLQLNGFNETFLGVGSSSGSGQGYNWFNIAGQAGFANMSWFAYYDGTDWRQTGGSVPPAKITGGGANTAFRFDAGTSNGADSVITWDRVMTIEPDGDLILSGSLAASSISVSDAGAYFTGTDQEAVNQEIGEKITSYAMLYNTGAGATDVAAATPEKIGGDTPGTDTQVTSLGDWDAATNDARITWTGTSTIYAAITVDVSSSLASVGDMYYYIAKNGTVISHSRARRNHGNTDFEDLTMRAHVELAQNDYIEVYCEPVTGTETVSISDMRIEAKIIEFR